jgi:hypothetical protein
MKKISSFVFLMLTVAPVFCQVMLNDSAFSNDERFFQPKKFDYHLTLGSQFTSASGFGSALNTYVTPHVSYNLNKRFSIGGGISIIRTNYFNARSYLRNEQTSGYSGNFTSAMIFVDGTYIVNNRLTIYGSAYKQLPVSKDPLPYNPFNPVSAKGAQGINFNVGYKVGEHVLIQAGFRYSEGVNPFYADPFSHNQSLNDSFGVQPGFGIPRW